MDGGMERRRDCWRSLDDTEQSQYVAPTHSNAHWPYPAAQRRPWRWTILQRFGSDVKPPPFRQRLHSCRIPYP
ncbi:hypothetical protein MRB53_034106 [Persea americana]|uniref:Uncharacterized protein n=1 Tax=Persea americana TaxID=3435 RepID=A0ACC2KWQ6_PERAE|nr:hypothetical protein MRB53_034106 [Persea americana]